MEFRKYLQIKMCGKQLTQYLEINNLKCLYKRRLEIYFLSIQFSSFDKEKHNKQRETQRKQIIKEDIHEIEKKHTIEFLCKDLVRWIKEKRETVSGLSKGHNDRGCSYFKDTLKLL